MTVGQKASISLLASTILAAAFAVVSYSGLFRAIETGFYDPRARREVDASLDAIAAAEASYQAVLLERFSAVISMDSFRRSFLSNQAFEDSQARLNALGLLAERTTGFRGARFVDLDGKRIHFSTFPADIAKEEPLRIVYRDYGNEGDPAWSALGVSEGAAPAVNLLGGSREFVYRFPFSDGLGVHRGTALFYVSLQGMLEHLVRERLVGLGDDLAAVGDDGLLLGLPAWAGPDFSARVGELWSSGPNAEPLPVGQSAGSEAFVLFSRRATAGVLGRLVPASFFEFPEPLRWLMLAAFFVTAYLACFLVLNLRQDRMAVLAAKIRRLQLGLVEEYLDRKGGLDPVRLGRELEARRAEVRQRVRSVAGSLARKRSGEVDALVDRSWDELIAMLSGRSREEPAMDITRIEALLREALGRGAIVVQGSPPAAGQAASVRPAARAEPAPATESVEELEEAEPLEELEEAEAVEDLAEAEAAEMPSEAEAAGELEEAESLEELEEAEAVEDLEAAEAAGELEEAEALDELEEAEAVEELEEAEAAGELAEAETAEVVEEAEAVDAVEEAEAAEAVEEAEEPEELEELAGEGIAEEWGNLSAEALALASAGDEDVPLIPEGLGLELVEETDMADVIGYIGMNQPAGAGYSEDGTADGLEELPSDDAEPELDIVLGSPFLSASQFMDDESAARLEAISPAEERARNEVNELLEEVEFDLFIGSLDLSGLEGYRDEEGFLEIGEAGVAEETVEEPAPGADERFMAEAASGELSMLSDEDRERMEELQVVMEVSTEEPVDAEALASWPLWSRYAPHGRSFDSMVGEIETLIAFGDAEIGELAPLGSAARGDGPESGDVIVLVDGVFTLNRDAMNPAAADPSLKALADSVLEN